MQTATSVRIASAFVARYTENTICTEHDRQPVGGSSLACSSDRSVLFASDRNDRRAAMRYCSSDTCSATHVDHIKRSALYPADFVILSDHEHLRVG